MTTLDEKIKNFRESINNYDRANMTSLLAKHGIGLEQYIEIVVSEVKNNDKLLEAFVINPNSMFASILFAAEIGLMPNEKLGEFYLIPRNIKQTENGKEKWLLTVTPLIGYKGMVKLILRSRDIKRLHAEVVYEGDEFTPKYGLEPDIIHVPNFNVERTADKIKYSYAVAKNSNGEYHFTVLTRKEIEAVRDTQSNKNKLYFNDEKGINRWMEKKTALIQLAKLLPIDYHTRMAIGYDGAIEAGAYLSLDEQKKPMLIENKEATFQKFKKGRDIYGEFAKATKHDRK